MKEENNNITQEQVLEAIKKNLEENRQRTIDFEQEVYQELKEDFERLQEISEEANGTK